MTPVFGIDPGTVQSAYVVWDGQAKEILEKATLPNDEFMDRFHRYPYLHPVGLEMVQNYGTPMGNDLIETIVFTGQIIWECKLKGAQLVKLRRPKIKVAICNDSKAKDGWIRQALIDRIGPVGTKLNPGPTYGVVAHEWQCLAAAVVCWDMLNGGKNYE